MNKMVDMQKAFDAVCKYFHLGNAMECNRLYSALEEAYELTAQPEPKWIPVEERLPEYGESVLCYYEDDDYGVNHIIDDEAGEWFIDVVIAWMPLPKPYERSEE